MPHIAVIGAGITGVTTAYSLHTRGFDVTVYDRQRYAGMETSLKEPTLRGNIIGGFWTQSDSTGDIHKFTHGLAKWLMTQGVQFRLGDPVTDLQKTDDGVTGLRPMMPNMMPRVGQGSHDRVFYNTGHGHLGWTLSPATAEAIGTTIAAHFAGQIAPPAVGMTLKTA